MKIDVDADAKPVNLRWTGGRARYEFRLMSPTDLVGTTIFTPEQVRGSQHGGRERHLKLKKTKWGSTPHPALSPEGRGSF